MQHYDPSRRPIRRNGSPWVNRSALTGYVLITAAGIALPNAKGASINNSVNWPLAFDEMGF
jgi:hypothetical protein